MTGNTIIINGTSIRGNDTFSLMSGPRSNFTIIEGNEDNFSASTFSITGGAGSFLNESSMFPGESIWGATTYSINLGTNSSVILGSDFQGNGSVSIVF